MGYNFPNPSSVIGMDQNNDTDETKMDPKKMASAVYDATLKVFHPRTGVCPNERLWFKTNLKYGQLLYEMNETPKLQQVLKDLKNVQSGGAADNISSPMNSRGGAMSHSSSSSATGSGTSQTQSMEIYA